MRNILICISDDDIRNEITTELDKILRFNIVVAKDGTQAFQKSSNQEFDLIVSDFDLPKICGKDLVRSVRQNVDNKKTPFLFLHNPDQDVAAVLEQTELYSTFPKPVTIDTLLTAMETQILDGLLKKIEFNIDVEVINPFIDATIKVLKEKCGLEKLNYSKPTNILQNLKCSIVASVAIVSEYYSGNLSICLKDEVFYNLAGKYTQSEISELNDESKDIAAQFIQEVFEEAKETIQRKKFKLQEAIPSLIDPQEFLIVNNKKERNIGIKFISDIGDFQYVVNVKKN